MRFVLSSIYDMSIVTLSSDFEVLIPKDVRETLGLSAGEQLRLISYDGRLELIPMRPVKSMRGFLRGMDSNIERDGDRPLAS